MLSLSAPPAGEPLVLSDVKAALRIETDADDALLERIVTVARAFLERRLDLAILRQSWTLTLTSVPLAPVCLRPGKVAAITGGTVRYGDAAPRPLADGEARLIRSVPARVALDLPAAENGAPLAELTVTFETGWADASAMPPELAHALMLLVAHYYEERQLFAAGRYVPVPATLQAHIEAFREVRL